jgi:hypothetical protein
MAINFPAKTIGQNIGDNHIDPITNLEWVWDGYSWNSVSAQDSDLTAIAGLTTTGLIKRTGDGTASIIIDNSANWDTAYGWGNHAIAGYSTYSHIDVGTPMSALTDAFVISNITIDGFGHITGVSSRELTPTNIGAATTVNYFSEINTTEWVGSSAPYTKTISILGILSSDKPFVDLDLSEVIYSEVESIKNSWGLIYRGTAITDGITFYADEIPDVNIPIHIKVVR